MRTILFFTLTLLLLTLSSTAYTSLRVQDPQKTWNSWKGTIDTAVLSIKPKGAYVEYGLYLTFSARPHHTYNDTFEIQMFFDLPAGAIVTDSWLWVGSQIVQADIRDRRKATLIYEGIVNRRKDPSILYKNSDTEYELRIFPLAPAETRKVKITYMLPAKWSSNQVSVPLPLNILKSSHFTPYFKILAYTDSVWHSPAIAETPTVNFQDVTPVPLPGSYSHYLVVPSVDFVNATEMNYTLTSPMQNGVFASKYEIDSLNGYYQLVVLPSKILTTQASRKMVLLFDYESGLSTTTQAEVLNKARVMLHDHFNAADSFNLMFSQLMVNSASPHWLPCDSATIEQTFNSLGANPISGLSNLPALLGAGISFLKVHDNAGEMILISNSDNFCQSATANQLVSAVQAQMSPHVYPINVVDFTNQNFDYFWGNNQYYKGNEYFNYNITVLTGGNYERAFTSNYYYGGSIRPFGEVMEDLFGSLQGKVSNLEVQADVQNGFCFARYNSSDGVLTYLSKPFVQIGKYYGSLPMEVEVSGQLGAMPFSQDVVIDNFYDADSATKKMWIGKYLDELENITNPDNHVLSDMMATSINNRVLSTVTAFLALEPSDTVIACEDCEDETNPNPTTGLDDLAADSLQLVAMPNPFSGKLNIKLHLAEGSGPVSLKVYNLMGQIVKEFAVDGTSGNDFTFEWDGQDNRGDVVPAGVYLLRLEGEKAAKTLKLVKQ